MSDVKATLRRLEPMIIEMHVTLPHLATKTDMADLRTELKTEIASVRTELKDEIASVRTELKAEIASVRTELTTEIASVRTELKDEMTDVKVSLADRPTHTYMWLIVGTMVASFACGLAGLAILK